MLISDYSENCQLPIVSSDDLPYKKVVNEIVTWLNRWLVLASVNECKIVRNCYHSVANSKCKFK